MKYPEFLKEKATIGLVAPSFGIYGSPYRDKYDKAVSMFEALGYKLYSVNHVFDFIHSAEISAKELEEFYLNEANDILISVAGGELMVEIQSLLNYDTIKQGKPKWFMGYSDNTNFTFPLTTICDVASIYGINITDFGTNYWDEAINNTYKLLTGEKLKFYAYSKCQHVDMKYEKPLDGYNYDTDTKWINAYGGDNIDITGRIIGGCLDCLDTICGTPYDNMRNFCKKYKNDGIIFYFEACDLSPMGVRRTLWKLKECGWFTNINGFIIGRANKPEPAFDYSHTDVAIEMLKEYNIPIITEFDTGHVPPMIPIINGSLAHVISNKDEKSIEFILK